MGAEVGVAERTPTLGNDLLLALREDLLPAIQEAVEQAVRNARPEEWLTCGETCDLLKISNTRLHELLKRQREGLPGGLESVVIGGGEGGRSRRIARSAIDRFMREQQAR
jgi:hypothetical protein